MGHCYSERTYDLCTVYTWFFVMLILRNSCTTFQPAYCLMCEFYTTFIQVLALGFICNVNAHWLFLTNWCVHVHARWTRLPTDTSKVVSVSSDVYPRCQNPWNNLLGVWDTAVTDLQSLTVALWPPSWPLFIWGNGTILFTSVYFHFCLNLLSRSSGWLRLRAFPQNLWGRLNRKTEHIYSGSSEMSPLSFCFCIHNPFWPRGRVCQRGWSVCLIYQWWQCSLWLQDFNSSPLVFFLTALHESEGRKSFPYAI